MNAASIGTTKSKHSWVAICAAIIWAPILCGTAQEVEAAKLKLNCVSAPEKCKYPSAKNTGVKAKIKKKSGKKKVKKIRFKVVPDQVKSGSGWHWDSKGFLSISEDKTKLKNYIVRGTIDVSASNVRIENVRIIVGGETFGIAIRGAQNTKIKRCTIGPEENMERLMVGIKDIYGDSENTTIRKCNIYGTSTGIQIGQGQIVRNYIHDLRAEPGDHLNGITSNGSTGRLVVDRNTIFNPVDQTDAIGLFQDFGVEANRLITNNLLAGGGYTIYAGENYDDNPSYNIKIINNRFSNLYYKRSGYYGHGTAFNSHGSGNVWSNNIWDHTGGAVPVP